MINFSSQLFERELGGGLFAAVDSSAESCVAADLQQSVLWQRIEWQLAWEWSILWKRVGHHLHATNLTPAYAVLSRFASVLLDVSNRKGSLLAQRKRVIF